MKQKLRYKVLLFLMQNRIYEYLLLHVIPYIRFTTYYTSLRGWKYQRGYKLLKPGDILLTKDKRKLTSLLIQGEFSHAAVCVDKNSEWEISEMTHTHYTKSCFFDVCKESDRVVILRCKDFDDAYTKIFISNIKYLQKAKYDIYFQLGINALACTELPYTGDTERRCQVSLEDVKGLGTKYISPTGWWKARNTNMELIWDSDTEILDKP